MAGAMTFYSRGPTLLRGHEETRVGLPRTYSTNGSVDVSTCLGLKKEIDVWNFVTGTNYKDIYLLFGSRSGSEL